MAKSKNMDIVYVQSHLRGFARGTVYPVLDYWRANGSAYKGSHSPVRCVNSRNVEGGTVIEVEGENVPAPDFDQVIKRTMNNVEPKIFLSDYAVAVVAKKCVDEDLEWMDELEHYRSLLNSDTQVDFGKKTNHVRKHNDETPHGILHKTPKGSTVAVDDTGKISHIAAKEGDSYSHRSLLNKAITAGGTRTEAYAQDHETYMAAGMIPVAWVEVSPKNQPEGFDPAENYSCAKIIYVVAEKADPEDVKFAYNHTAEEWMAAVKPNRSINEANKRAEEYEAGEKKIRYEKTMNDEKEERRRARQERRRYRRPSLDTTYHINRKRDKSMEQFFSDNMSDWEAPDEQEYDYYWEED